MATFNNSTNKPLVLVAPLDWGLGHTTRCIPLIRELINQGCEIVVACNSRQKHLLEWEFPQVRYVSLEGYNIRYGKNRWLTFGWLFIQGVKILTKIKEENRWLAQFLIRERIAAIVSDNRFGLYHPSLPSVFITHQLQIRSGLGPQIDSIARRWNYRHIERFSTCWVPDNQGSASLAGHLSHPAIMPRTRVTYIGSLSRLQAKPVPENNSLLVLLSGPEPQRSIFEQLLLQQINHYTAGPVILVRGLPEATSLPAAPAHCQVLNHAPAAMLEELIARASYVISRCGYTSVMDLLQLHKKTILIPTPGQAEQEYLASHLLSKGWAFTCAQKDFSLKDILQQAASFVYKQPATTTPLYKEAITTLVKSIRSI